VAVDPIIVNWTVNHYTVHMPTEAKPGKYGRQPFRQMIREAGLTNEKTALAIGMSTNLVTMASNGQTAVSLQVAGRLSLLFGVPIEELFTDEMLYGDLKADGLELRKLTRKAARG